MKNQPQDRDVVKNAAQLATMLEQVIIKVEKDIEHRITPVRSQVTKRFPTLFILLSSLGLISTYLAMEQILLQYNVIEENPFLLLFMGVAILTFTGTLYKKLG